MASKMRLKLFLKFPLNQSPVLVAKMTSLLSSALKHYRFLFIRILVKHHYAVRQNKSQMETSVYKYDDKLLLTVRVIERNYIESLEFLSNCL